MREMAEQPISEASLHIRRAGPEDRDFLRQLAQKVFSVYGSYDRYLTDWSDSDETITWIGEIDDERVGLAMLAVHPKPGSRTEAIAELLAIAVEPPYQSRGVGTVFLEKVIEEASRLPAPIVEMHLSVAEGNARAQRLFAREGFRLTVGEGVYPAGQRALHMVKVL